jgi:hypothetical protein
VCVQLWGEEKRVVRKVSKGMLFVLSELFIGKVKVALLEVNNVPVSVVFSSREYFAISVLALRFALLILPAVASAGRRGRA